VGWNVEIERVVGANDHIELWAYDWDMSTSPAKKVNRKFVGLDQSATDETGVEVDAICWSYGRTLGNITVSSEKITGSFPDPEGDDALLDCDIVAAGKMRNGKDRWWCRTHQRHWGTLADISDASAEGRMRCSNHMQPMSYVVDPQHITIQDFAEVGIWCSMPPAITHNGPGARRRPKIHVHVRQEPGRHKVIDQDFQALSLQYNAEDNLFGNQEITKVHLTPPSALEFVLALEMGKAMGCINCRDCGYPHLDLGEFARKPHTKHLCGNCGRDNTRSTKAIASTPLKPLHDQFHRASHYENVTRQISLDEYEGLPFQVWASTPAVLWTADRPQERGIHVHVYQDADYLVDDTFGTVTYQGNVLVRSELFELMVNNTIN
jgi:transposase-like protein